MMNTFRRLLAAVSLFLLFIVSQAQPGNNETTTKEARPYKILTSGRQITIKSIRNIQHVMLWTTSGYRVVEQKEINNNSIVINIPVSHKTFFLMIGLNNGKIYTEKIGIQ
jgi:hypothetical protein